MEEYDNIDISIEVLKSLLKQRGYDYEYFPDDHSVVFIDGMGTVRECWPAGTDNAVVNVAIAITPEEVLSVDNLSGVIAENAKLKKLLKSALNCIDYGDCESCYCDFDGCTLRSAMGDLGIEVE